MQVADQDDSAEKQGQVKEGEDQVKEDRQIKVNEEGQFKDEKVKEDEKVKTALKPTTSKEEQSKKEKNYASASQKFLQGVEEDKEKVQALQEKVEEKPHPASVAFFLSFFIYCC